MEKQLVWPTQPKTVQEQVVQNTYDIKVLQDEVADIISTDDAVFATGEKVSELSILQSETPTELDNTLPSAQVMSDADDSTLAAANLYTDNKMSASFTQDVILDYFDLIDFDMGPLASYVIPGWGSYTQIRLQVMHYSETSTIYTYDFDLASLPTDYNIEIQFSLTAIYSGVPYTIRYYFDASVGKFVNVLGPSSGSTVAYAKARIIGIK